MLNMKEALFRFFVAMVLYFLSGSGTVTGNVATVCGLLGTVELATALLRYSPLMDLLGRYPAITYYISFGLVPRHR